MERFQPILKQCADLPTTTRGDQTFHSEKTNNQGRHEPAKPLEPDVSISRFLLTTGARLDTELHIIFEEVHKSVEAAGLKNSRPRVSLPVTKPTNNKSFSTLNKSHY